MNGCGAFCSYCGKCGRKIDERLVRNKPANVSPPGVALHLSLIHISTPTAANVRASDRQEDAALASAKATNVVPPTARFE